MSACQVFSFFLPFYNKQYKFACFATLGRIFVTKFEFGGSLGLSLEGDCHNPEVTPILELLVTFGLSLEGVWS
jgi:hypothetical protein